MTTLVVNPLTSTLTQSFRLKNSVRYSIGAFIPYLYVTGLPSGTFSFTVKNEDDDTVFNKTFTAAELQTALETSDSHFHTFHPMISSNPTQLGKGLYSATLSSSGYSYSMSSFIGWIHQHENLNNELDYTPLADNQNPLAMRLKIYKQGIKI